MVCTSICPLGMILLKLLFLLESTAVNDEVLYLKAAMDLLAGDGYEVTLVFTSRGTPSDHTYQLVKNHVVHHLSRLCFREEDDGYTERLARHIDKYQYDCLVATQSRYGRLEIAALYGMLEHKPRLVFVGSHCSQAVTQSASEIAALQPSWVAMSQNVATRFMPEYDVQVIYGPALVPEDTGADIRAEFGIKPEARLLGYIGNVDMVKWDVVIEAVKRMQCGLLVAGAGDRIQQLSEIHGLVKVVPAIPHCRGDWYRAMNCLILPVRSSAFPMLAMEAAMTGCPVAMTPVSDMYQMGQGQFGFFGFRPEEIIAGVREAFSHRHTVGAFVGEKFSQDRFLSDWHILLSGTQ